jgi:hypothetical protein
MNFLESIHLSQYLMQEVGLDLVEAMEQGLEWEAQDYLVTQHQLHHYSPLLQSIPLHCFHPQLLPHRLHIYSEQDELE